MFNRLRMRFIALSMASLLLVLAVILGAVNLITYRHVVEDADAVLDVLAENGGSFPMLAGRGDEMGVQPPAPGQDGVQPPEDPAGDPPDGMNGDIGDDAGQKRDRGSVRTAEMPYESRYFTATADESGAVTQVNLGRIAAVNETQAAEYAAAALASGKTCGFADDYRWRAVDTDGGRMIIFLDCGRNLSTFRSFLLSSLGVSAAGLAAVFLLILAFSGRVVRPVAESYEKQKRFITDAGHEIKTPLAIIAADADVLETELDCESEWLSDIRLQTKRLTDLTNDLVYLSRMEEPGAAQMVEFPLSDVVEETAQSFRSRALRKRQTFTEHIAPMLSLKGDEKAIRQLVGILLDNAVKYAPEEGEIELALERQGKGIALSVRNTTETPVPKESLDKLFDRFYRTDPSRSSETGGHGIGLSIARAVVGAHRGRISAESRDGRTLSITAWFPADKS